ncbi:MAG: n-acetylglutamate synthase, partial [Hymenobacter sp.]
MTVPVNYHNRTFRSVNTSANGEVGEATIFQYQQTDEVVMASYTGGDIRHGMLLARADCFGHLDARYQHLNHHGILMTGTCQTVPEVLP